MNFRESYFEFKSYQGGYAREAGLHLLTGDCRENCASALTKNWVSLIVFIIAGTFLGKVVGGPWRASAGAWWDLAAARREVECLRLELGVGGAGAGPRASYCRSTGSRYKRVIVLAAAFGKIALMRQINCRCGPF